jgi:hypothetical protein
VTPILAHGVIEMESSRHSSEVVGGDIDVLVIHGVGNHAVGGVTRLVTETLKRTLPDLMPAIRVSEYNWNSIVEPSARSGAILWAALEDLSNSLARASAIGDGSLASNRFARLLRILSAFVLMFAELGLAATLAGLVLVCLLALSVGFANNEALLRPALHAGISFIYWSLIAAVGALPLLIVLGMARSLTLGTLAPFLVESRRALIFFFRPFLILSYSFFFIPWRRVAGGVWIEIFSITALAMIPFMIFMGLFGWWLDPSSFKWTEVVSAGVTVYAWMIALSLGVFAIAFVTVRKIAPSLKVLLDIFRYIGTVGYREKIQSHMDAVLRERFITGNPERQIYILSHSLGTVIALDSLLSSGEWGRYAQITLVTLGSPIRRFFMRFFPELFFPASATAAAAAVAARVNFKWINCYRPLDQVGAAIGLSGLAYCRDVSTNQWTRLWDAHLDYWSDDYVASAIAKATSAAPMKFVDAEQSDQLALQHYTDDGADEVEKFRQKVFAAICRVVAIAFLAAPVIFGAAVVWSNYSQSVSEAAEVGIIEASGINTLAAVTHWRKTVPLKGGADITDNFEITYTSADGESRKSTITHNDRFAFETASYQVSVDALLDHVRSRCSDVDPRPTKRITLKYDRRCRLEGIRLRYNPDAPDRFVLPDFAADRSWGQVLRGSIFQIVIDFFALVMASATVIMVVGTLAAMLIGVNLRIKP